MNSTLPLIDRWKSLTVLVIGDVMLDCYLNGHSDRLCQEAPVPVVAVTQRQDFPGGAANTAANIASLGARAIPLSVVGTDAESERLHHLLKQRGITTEYLITHSDRTTLAKYRVVSSSHLLVRFDQGSTTAISPILEKQLIQQLIELFPQCDAVVVSDYSYGIVTPQIMHVLKNLQAQYSRTLVIDSKQLNSYREVAATAVKPNYAETIRLLELPKQLNARASQILPFGDRILDLTGAQIAAVTLDTEGAIVFERDQPPLRLYANPAPPNQTSGAGDTFISTLTLALAAKAPTSAAAALAAAATAIVVKQPGTTVCNAEDLRQAEVRGQMLGVRGQKREGGKQVAADGNGLRGTGHGARGTGDGETVSFPIPRN